MTRRYGTSSCVANHGTGCGRMIHGQIGKTFATSRSGRSRTSVPSASLAYRLIVAATSARSSPLRDAGIRALTRSSSSRKLAVIWTSASRGAPRSTSAPALCTSRPAALRASRSRSGPPSITSASLTLALCCRNSGLPSIDSMALPTLSKRGRNSFGGCAAAARDIGQVRHASSTPANVYGTLSTSGGMRNASRLGRAIRMKTDGSGRSGVAPLGVLFRSVNVSEEVGFAVTSGPVPSSSASSPNDCGGNSTMSRATRVATSRTRRGSLPRTIRRLSRNSVPTKRSSGRLSGTPKIDGIARAKPAVRSVVMMSRSRPSFVKSTLDVRAAAAAVLASATRSAAVARVLPVVRFVPVRFLADIIASAIRLEPSDAHEPAQFSTHCPFETGCASKQCSSHRRTARVISR